MNTEVFVCTRDHETTASFLAASSNWLDQATLVHHPGSAPFTNAPQTWSWRHDVEPTTLQAKILSCATPTLVIVGDESQKESIHTFVTKNLYRRKSMSMLLWWDKSRHSFPSMLSIGTLPSTEPSPMRSPSVLIFFVFTILLLTVSFYGGLMLLSGFLISKLLSPKNRNKLPPPRQIGTQGADARASVFLEEKRLQIRTSTSAYLNFWIHPQLGWTHARMPVSGEQHIHSIQQGTSHKWRFHFDAHGFRTTTSSPSSTRETSKRILWLGCSIAEGWGVDEQDWCVTLVENEMPQWKLTNRAVGNYSIYQMYLNLLEETKNTQYDAVVACLHDGLTWRISNYFRRFYRNRAQPIFDATNGNITPLGSLAPKGPNSVDFSFPNSWLPSSIKKKHHKNETSQNRLLIETMQNVCDTQGTPLLFLGVDRFTDYKRMLAENDYHWIDTGVDRFDKKNHGQRNWTLWPFDGHPNQAAHKRYATTACDALKLIFDSKKIPHFDEASIVEYSRADRVPTDTYTLT